VLLELALDPLQALPGLHIPLAGANQVAVVVERQLARYEEKVP
jgi:hypothetical protein